MMDNIKGIFFKNGKVTEISDFAIYSELSNGLFVWHETVGQKKLSIQYDGKLYNTHDLKKVLQLPTSADDAELILHGYKRWGIKILLSRLEGIFSFVIFDKECEQLFLARDHVGVKPLFFYHTPKVFAFSSSLRYLAESDIFEKKLSDIALRDYFTYGFILQPDTIYSDCYKVRSGYFLTYDLRHDLLYEERYWGLGACYEQTKLNIDETLLQQEIAQLLTNAVRKQLVGVQEIGVSLSGGYDSSTLAALLQTQSRQKIKTFTIGFEDAKYDEAPDARKIAKYIGAEHTEYRFTAQDAVNVVPMLSEVFAEPFYNNGAIPTLLLSQIVHGSGLDTLFVGDGGDEVFATADDAGRFEAILGFPRPLKKGVAKLLQVLDPTRLPYLRHYKNMPTRYYKMVQMLDANDIPSMVKLRLMLFYPYEQEKLLLHHVENEKNMFAQIGFGPYAESVDQIIGSYFKSLLINAELVKTTQSLGLYQITPRMPYLDKALIELMAKVPAKLKIKGGVKKYLLKNIAHNYIPEALLDRPKKGFSIPFSKWMREELKPLVDATLSPENLVRDGVLNPRYVMLLKKEFYRGNEDYKYKLWAIFLFQLWYEKHMR